MHGLCAFGEWCLLCRSYRYAVAITHEQRASPRQRRHYCSLCEPLPRPWATLPALAHTKFLRFPSAVPCLTILCKRPRMNQRRTKEPRKNSKTQKVRFLKIAVSFPSLIPYPKTPTDHRENTERRARKLLHDFS